MKKIVLFTIISLSLYANPLNFNTIKSNFVQTIKNDENKTIKYKGEFFATSNSKALWIYKYPINKSIYFNKKQVVIIEPELEQVIITNLRESPNLTQIIKNAKRVGTNSYETTFNDVKYTLTIKNNKIETIKYSDKLGNQVTIQLSKQKIDTPIKEHIFKPIIPKEYDIISE